MSMFKNMKAKASSSKVSLTDPEIALATEMIDGILAEELTYGGMRSYIINNPEEFAKNFPGRKPYTIMNHIKKEVETKRKIVLDAIEAEKTKQLKEEFAKSKK